MIGSRERARSEKRSVFGAKAAILILWVILVFALLCLFLSIIHYESRSRSSYSYSIKPPLPKLHREGKDSSSSFRRALFHEPSSSTSRTRTSTTAQASIYGEDKRVIHTGPNPLHN